MLRSILVLLLSLPSGSGFPSITPLLKATTCRQISAIFLFAGLDIFDIQKLGVFFCLISAFMKHSNKWLEKHNIHRSHRHYHLYLRFIEISFSFVTSIPASEKGENAAVSCSSCLFVSIPDVHHPLSKFTCFGRPGMLQCFHIPLVSDLHEVTTLHSLLACILPSFMYLIDIIPWFLMVEKFLGFFFFPSLFIYLFKCRN